VLNNVRTLSSISIREFRESDSSYFAAGISFWFIFSLFPLILAAISITGFLYPSHDSQDIIVTAIRQTLPISGDYIADVVLEVAAARGVFGLLAFVTLLISGVRLFTAIRRGVNHAWRPTVRHTFIQGRAIDAVMLGCSLCIVLLLVVFALTALGIQLPFGNNHGIVAVGELVLREVMAIGVAYSIFLLLYRYLPNAEIQWRDVWLGAVVAVLLFRLATLGFTWYIGAFDSFNLVFGSLGMLMAVLGWAYLSSQSLMWGAHVCAVYSRLYGSRSLQPQYGCSQTRRPLEDSGVNKIEI
jgi:membrane protein